MYQQHGLGEQMLMTATIPAVLAASKGPKGDCFSCERGMGCNNSLSVDPPSQSYRHRRGGDSAVVVICACTAFESSEVSICRLTRHPR
jgi:hypothetical protein